MNVVEIGAILLVIMLVFLTGGIWIAITLAMVGWIGLAVFTNKPPMIWGCLLYTSDAADE